MDAVQRTIAELLNADEFPESGGVWRPSTRSVARIGFALEPWPGLGDWVHGKRLDTLFLHRPWRLDADALDTGVGVLWSHLPFDERMTIGLNPHLASALGMGSAVPFGEKEGRPLGMLGGVSPAPVDEWIARIEGVFGGAEESVAGTRDGPVRRVAAVGAMTDALVRAAAERGADLFLTGLLRKPAAWALRETGMAAVAVGHRRSEEWGLRTRARLLETRCPRLEAVVWLEGEGRLAE